MSKADERRKKWKQEEKELNRKVGAILEGNKKIINDPLEAAYLKVEKPARNIDEISLLIHQFIINDEKAIEYYESNKINYDSMLKMKSINAENIVRLIDELRKKY